MQTRFVIVPAVPIEKQSFRIGTRFYAATVCGGFDIYDNQEKERLKPSYPSKTAAELQCRNLNMASGVAPERPAAGTVVHAAPGEAIQAYDE